MVKKRKVGNICPGFYLRYSFPLGLSSKDLLSNAGHAEALCLVLGEEVSKQLVWHSTPRAPVFHYDRLIQLKNMAPHRACWL